MSKSLTTGRNNTGREVRTVILPNAREYVLAADFVKAKSTLYMSEAEAAGRKLVSAHPRCDDPAEAAEFVGSEKLLGFDVYHYVQRRHSGSLAQAKRTDIWLAPDLNCRPLKMTATIVADDGSIRSVFERSAMSVTVGEPDPALFDIPLEYREMAPSQAYSEMRTKVLREAGDEHVSQPEIPSGFEHMDREYWSSRSDAPAP